MQFLELTDHAADDAERGAVAVEDRVESLLLLCRIVGIGITDLPLLMARTGLPTPSPEIQKKNTGNLGGLPPHPFIRRGATPQRFTVNKCI